ncbi:MAG: hypothetical protein AAFQ80_19810, partial [Cyanobacteria bacterium J06621_8]
MNIEQPRSYNAIIERTLAKAIKLAAQSPKSRKLGRRGIAGFCQLQGPTGGGKSSSLYRKGFTDNTAPALELIKNTNRQAILVTHRWNILHDIYHSAVNQTDSKGQPFSVSVLYAQDQNVVSAVTQTPLPHEGNLHSSDMPNPLESIKRLAGKGLLIGDEIAKKLSKTGREIENISRTLDDKNLARQYYLAIEKERRRRSCASIEHTLLKNMFALEKAVKTAREKSGENSKETKAAVKRLKRFRDDPWVRRIFPAICWRDDQQHLLIMTTQKLFSSFYDGQNKVRISHQKLSGHVIFIDEFDYQADVLQQLLAQTQKIKEPPQCLGQLLDEGKRLLQRMQYVKDEPMPKITQRLQDFLTSLEEELEAKNIDLVDSRALVIPLKDHQEGKSFQEQFLFRSDHLVTSQPLTMSRAPHGYEIEPREIQEDTNATENFVDVGAFLRLMEKFIRRFGLLLSNFASTEDEAQEYLRQLSELLFDSVNDYRPSYYGSTLSSLSLFSLPQINLDELKHLIESNILPNTHANVYGLTSWLLKQNQRAKKLDPLRIQIRRAFLPTTPEGLLLSLSSRNLVFALSATSYIERAMGHFDIRWLTSALKYIAEARTPTISTSFLGNEFGNRPKTWFKQPIPYVQCEEDFQLQHTMIEQVSQSKATQRKTKLKLHIHEFEDVQESDAGQEMLEALSPDFFQPGSEPITDSEQKHREEVLCMLLDVVSTAGKNPDHKGQLAFVNSTRYFRKWLLEQEAQPSRDSISWLRLDSDFSSIIGKDKSKTLNAKSFNKIFIPAVVHDVPAIICLLTAEVQKKVSFRDAYQEAFNTDRVVIVLTQTASATNGINLDFKAPDSGDQMDLTCLYLLEAQHFYFSKFEQSDDEKQDEMAHAGDQLRNLDKLCRAGELSRADQRRYILPLMTNYKKEISKLNKLYQQKTNDYWKNTAANVQQQVGRIERAWRHIPQVDIYLTSTLAGALSKFASQPIFNNNRRLISDLNIQLLETVLEKREAEQPNLIEQLMTPPQTGEEAVDIIDNKLVVAIRDSRNGEHEIEMLTKIWHQLGKAILQHDYKWKPE